MSNAPEVKPGEWIKVGSVDCVVADIAAIDPQAADLHIICNEERPSVYAVNWNGEAWEFAHPMRGSYADHTPGAEPFVGILRKGPPQRGPQEV